MGTDTIVMQLIGVNLKGGVVVAYVYNNIGYQVMHNTEEVCLVF